MAAAAGSELNVIGQQDSTPRADAVRNRRKILDAAERLIDTVGVHQLTMDEVARVAEVGVGTVYRRFGDLSGLANALLHDRECELQDAFMTGKPPLGPGAPPATRVVAFLHALLDRVVDQHDLLIVAETHTPTARYVSGAYVLHSTHLVKLVTEADPELDAQFVAEMLLASVSASLILHQRSVRQMSLQRIKDGLAAVAERVLTAPERPQVS